MSQQHHISQNESGKPILTDELLMSYIEGKLSPKLHHEVEALLSEESAEADAIEGLQLLHPADVKNSASKLQYSLHKTLLKTKYQRAKQSDFWSWIALFIILLLIAVAYTVVYIASN